MKKFLSAILIIMMLITSMTTLSVSADTGYSASEWDGTTKDTSWYNPDSSSKRATLYTAAQLAGFAEISETESFVDWTIKLGTDIVWNKGDAATFETTAPANVWTPIKDFWGTFDGQGHTVSGLYYNDDTVANVGFFASINGAIVKNLSVVNSYFCARHLVGGIAGQAKEYKAEIENCYTDVIIHAYTMQKDKSKTDVSYASVGGILGENVANGTSIANCWTEGKIIAYAPWDGQAVSDNSDNKACGVGGVVGSSQRAVTTIKNCISSAFVEGHSQIGGIFGRVGTATGTLVENCIFLGTVRLTRERDLDEEGPYAKNCVTNYSGSIVGIVMTCEISIKNCYALDTYAAIYMKEDLLKHTYKTAFWCSNNDRGTITFNSTMYSVSAESIKGDTAKTTLNGFDFTNVWATGANSPEIAALSYIAKNKASNVPPSDPADADPEENIPPSDNNGNAAPNEGSNANQNDNEAGSKDTATSDTTADTQNAGGSDAIVTEAATGGCGSAIGMASVAVIAFAGAAALIGKKKED